MRPNKRRKKASLPKQLAKGTAKGLGKLAGGAAVGVVTELASVLSLGLYKPRKR